MRGPEAGVQLVRGHHAHHKGVEQRNHNQKHKGQIDQDRAQLAQGFALAAGQAQCHQ